jgi:hypothetical protein
MHGKLGLLIASLASFIATTPAGCVPDVTLRSTATETDDAAAGGSGPNRSSTPAGRDAGGRIDASGGSASGGAPAGGASAGGVPSSGGTSPHDASSEGGKTSNGHDSSAGADAGHADATPDSDARSPGSTCEGGLDVCSPSVCRPATYGGDYLRQSATSTVLADVGVFGVQNILSGASSDGNVIMEQRWCGGDGSTWLYDGDLATRKYTGTDITSELSDIGIGEGHRYLAPDGLTIVATRLDGPGFTARRRASRSSTSFSAADASAFTNVNDWVASSNADVAYPTISFDGLALYFTWATPGNVRWPTYEVRRARLDLPFERPSAPVLDGSDYTQVSAAPDPWTIFIQRGWGVAVLVRPWPGAAFEQLELIPNLIRAVPVEASCGIVLANASPGGCMWEEVFVVSAQRGDAGPDH